VNSNPADTALDATRLKQLRFVATVARLGSMVEAARALHMTASAASMLLRSVEQGLGGPLFERTAHGMVPTARALALLPRLQAVLGEADALAAAAASPDPRPVVRIGFVAHVSATVLPKAVSALVGATTQRVQLIEGRAALLAQMLHDGQLDFLLGKMPADFAAGRLARLSMHLLYEDGLVVVARKGHGLARKRRAVSLPELQDVAWVLPPAGSTTQAAFVQAWLQAGQIPPQPAVECPSYAWGLGVVEASDMLSCCAASAARHSTHAIVVLDTRLQLKTLPVGLFWRTGSTVAETLAPVLHEAMAADIRRST
jgi:DNA-binding transcriptional LysR family regulator